MDRCQMPAPGEGAGDDTGASQPQNRVTPPFTWAVPEIILCPWMVSYAAYRALDYAEAVHDFDCEDRGQLFPNNIWERCDDPLLLMRYLPDDAIDAVRHEAERMLRAWSM